MGLISTIAFATRGRIVPAGSRGVIAMATLGWILTTATPVPQPSGGGGPDPVQNVGGRYWDIVEQKRLQQLKMEDEEILLFIKAFMKCQER